MAAVEPDLAGAVELVECDAEAVLLGGADETGETADVFSYDNLNRAFAELDAGAGSVSLHRNRWWQTSRGPLLDSGAFVAGLEYAAGVEAEVVGKPSLAYFEAALAELGAEPGEAVMVGDDIDADIGGGQGCGTPAPFSSAPASSREETLAAADAKPDVVLDSIADVPAFLRESA